MKIIDSITSKLKRVLQNSIYHKDWQIVCRLVSKRDITGLNELVESIVAKEESKPLEERVINYDMLIEAWNILGMYVEQLEYSNNNE